MDSIFKPVAHTSVVRFPTFDFLAAIIAYECHFEHPSQQYHGTGTGDGTGDGVGHGEGVGVGVGLTVGVGEGCGVGLGVTVGVTVGVGVTPGPLCLETARYTLTAPNTMSARTSNTTARFHLQSIIFPPEPLKAPP